jgi:hypothetical protein
VRVIILCVIETLATLFGGWDIYIKLRTKLGTPKESK